MLIRYNQMHQDMLLSQKTPQQQMQIADFRNELYDLLFKAIKEDDYEGCQIILSKTYSLHNIHIDNPFLAHFHYILNPDNDIDPRIIQLVFQKFVDLFQGPAIIIFNKLLFLIKEKHLPMFLKLILSKDSKPIFYIPDQIIRALNKEMIENKDNEISYIGLTPRQFAFLVHYHQTKDDSLINDTNILTGGNELDNKILIRCYELINDSKLLFKIIDKVPNLKINFSQYIHSLTQSTPIGPFLAQHGTYSDIEDIIDKNRYYTSAFTDPDDCDLKHLTFFLGNILKHCNKEIFLKILHQCTRLDLTVKHHSDTIVGSLPDLAIYLILNGHINELKRLLRNGSMIDLNQKFENTTLADYMFRTGDEEFEAYLSQHAPKMPLQLVYKNTSGKTDIVKLNNTSLYRKQLLSLDQLQTIHLYKKEHSTHLKMYLELKNYQIDLDYKFKLKSKKTSIQYETCPSFLLAQLGRFTDLEKILKNLYYKFDLLFMASYIDGKPKSLSLIDLLLTNNQLNLLFDILKNQKNIKLSDINSRITGGYTVANYFENNAGEEHRDVAKNIMNLLSSREPKQKVVELPKSDDEKMRDDFAKHLVESSLNLEECKLTDKKTNIVSITIKGPTNIVDLNKKVKAYNDNRKSKIKALYPEKQLRNQPNVFHINGKLDDLKFLFNKYFTNIKGEFPVQSSDDKSKKTDVQTSTTSTTTQSHILSQDAMNEWLNKMRRIFTPVKSANVESHVSDQTIIITLPDSIEWCSNDNKVYRYTTDTFILHLSSRLKKYFEGQARINMEKNTILVAPSTDISKSLEDLLSALEKDFANATIKQYGQQNQFNPNKVTVEQKPAPKQSSTGETPDKGTEKVSPPEKTEVKLSQDDLHALLVNLYRTAFGGDTSLAVKFFNRLTKHKNNTYAIEFNEKSYPVISNVISPKDFLNVLEEAYPLIVSNFDTKDANGQVIKTFRFNFTNTQFEDFKRAVLTNQNVIKDLKARAFTREELSEGELYQKEGKMEEQSSTTTAPTTQHKSRFFKNIMLRDIVGLLAYTNRQNIDIHIDRLSRIEKPSNNSLSQVDYLLYLLHSLRIFDELKIAMDANHLAKLDIYKIITDIRDIIRHGYDELTWEEFYQHTKPIIDALENVLKGDNNNIDSSAALALLKSERDKFSERLNVRKMGNADKKAEKIPLLETILKDIHQQPYNDAIKQEVSLIAASMLYEADRRKYSSYQYVNNIIGHCKIGISYDSYVRQAYDAFLQHEERNFKNR